MVTKLESARFSLRKNVLSNPDDVAPSKLFRNAFARHVNLPVS